MTIKLLITNTDLVHSVTLQGVVRTYDANDSLLESWREDVNDKITLKPNESKEVTIWFDEGYRIQEDIHK